MTIPVPYSLWMGLAQVLRPIARKLPGLLRVPVLRARLMPLSYPNTALRHALGGQDDAPLEDMLKRSAKEGS